MEFGHNIRTRVAPSPTGDPHIGTAYVALFNYVFAKSRGGRFLLRIEDTDQTRSTSQSEAAILESLAWLGLAWDEGPDIGGPAGPYRQSERTEIYREHARRLVQQGRAYPSFATAEQLAELRRTQEQQKQQPGYRGQFDEPDRPPEEALSRWDSGEPCVIRLKVPAEGECVVDDRLRGQIRIPWSQVDHQVLLKTDGFPTYHLANVVDDHLMGITHVIRGEEWISSAPKHLLLYESFGWTPPELVHLPLLRNPDKSKLSKRKHPTGIGYYRRAGYLPEAILNYLALMAYPPVGEDEKASLHEMIAGFELDRISLGGPVFDVAKLAWLNGRYLREDLDVQALLDRLRQWSLNDDTWRRILPLVQPRAEKLADIVPMAAYLLADMPDYAPEDLLGKGLEGEEAARFLQIVLWELEGLRPWTSEAIKKCLERVAEREQIKLRKLLPPLFVALSGAPVALPLFESMQILGPDMSRRRLHHALGRLAEAGYALGRKKLKKLEKDYQARYG